LKAPAATIFIDASLKSGPDLLAGRALTLFLHPLTAAELGKDFDLNHSLTFGNLPCAYTESEPKRYLESYVKTVLEEEIRQEGLTRNLGAFSRFLEAAGFSRGLSDGKGFLCLRRGTAPV
jgi:predicted AAA+ superfamily ATPase